MYLHERADTHTAVIPLYTSASVRAYPLDRSFTNTLAWAIFPFAFKH